MPAKDIYHDQCKNALIHDGWTITHDPYLLRWGPKDLYIDLGAEQLIGAERANQLIARVKFLEAIIIVIIFKGHGLRNLFH